MKSSKCKSYDRILAATVLFGVISAGCAVRSAHDRMQVSRRLQERTGYGLAPEKTSAITLPDGINLADGLSEDEAVAIALWNNAAFQADLAALGFARADLIEAGLLRNPILSLLFPVGPKQLEASATWPVELLWQRPRRIAAAQLESERVAEDLVQHGLDLARDVKIAHADLLRAQERTRLAEDAVRLRGEIAKIAQARLRAGDVSELETSAATIDARVAEEEAARSTREAAMAHERLRSLLGLDGEGPSFELTSSAVALKAPPELSELLKLSFAARPDLRAAELAIEAAVARAGWERSRFLAIAAILDFNQQGTAGPEAGPGIQVDLAAFNQNQGGVARAAAELERAARRYTAVRHQIALEIREGHARFLQARDALEVWRSRVVTPLEEVVQTSDRAFSAGDVSYLFVLENARRLHEARVREAEITADLRRAAAALERGVGRKLP